MNKVKIFLVTVCITLLLMPTVLVAGNKDDMPSLQENTPVTSIDKLLRIDNDNIYENMDKTYNNGYSPTVQDDTVLLVLPLISTDSILHDQIRVTFNLGDPASAPFQFENYDKTVLQGSHSVNNGSDIVDSFLISIDIPLAENRIAGRFPVIITAAGQWGDGSSFSQEFMLYVTISEENEPNVTPTPEPIPTSETPPELDFIPGTEPSSGSEPSPTAKPEETPVPQAKILLERFSVKPSSVETGEEFDFSAVFRNTNGSQSLNNVKITVTEETADIVPVGENTGSFYFEKIAKEESVTIEMKMKVAHNAKAEPHKIKFNIEYEGHNATAYTTVAETAIQIMQPIRLKFDEPQIPKEVNAGDTISVTMNVMNLGLSTVHNVQMIVEAQGLLPEKTVFLGNIESGTAKKGDLYAFVGTLDMTNSEVSQNKDKYGMTEGKVLLSYEDEYRREYTEEFKFSTNINPPVIMANEEPEKNEEPKKQGQWWISVIIVGGILIAIACIQTYIKAKQRRIRQQEDDHVDSYS